jgi:hypothetical protein
MATFYTNKNYESPYKIPYDYGYSRATTTSQPLGILGKPKPSTSSNSGRGSQLCKMILNDTEQTNILVNKPKPYTTQYMHYYTLGEFQSTLGKIFPLTLSPDYLVLMALL